MSGSKVVAVAGISQAATGAGAGISTATIAVGTATVLGLSALVAAAGAVVALTGKALQAYQERVRKEREATEKRERDTQRCIAEIRAQIRSSAGQSKVTVQLPTAARSAQPPTSTSLPESAAVAKDTQRKIEALKSQLPKIRSEYQALIEQQLLDESTVQQAIQKTEQALKDKNIAVAEAHLQALDDARIQVMQRVQSQWSVLIQYSENRLEEVRSRIPAAIVVELQDQIDRVKNNWQQLSDAEIEALHQQINAFESQADSIQEAAEKLIESQRLVGYKAYLREMDNGDAVVEVETHEGVNTQIRIDFYGQQIALSGPPEESNSCAARTVEAMRLFREQGYQLEWTEWDGEPVTEELRYLYSVPSSETSETQTGTEGYQKSQRRRETQGY
jgi:uncharacterized protein YdcH (DUF465 family)